MTNWFAESSPKKPVNTYPANWEEWTFGQDSKAICDMEVTADALRIVLDSLLPVRPPLYRKISLKALLMNPAWDMLCLEDPTLIESYQRCQARAQDGAYGEETEGPNLQIPGKRVGYFNNCAVRSNVFPEAYQTGALVCLSLIHGIGRHGLLPALQRAGATIGEGFATTHGMMVEGQWHTRQEFNLMVVADKALHRFLENLEQTRRPMRGGS